MSEMNVNFPNRAPAVVRDQELRVVRRLPGSGDIKVRAGDRIGANQVLVRTDPKSAAIRISVADQLGVAPQDVGKHLMKPVGSVLAAGEAMARNRKGLRNVVVASPIAGTLLSVDDDTGIALIAPAAGGDILSMVAGDVEFIDGKQSVSIRTVGSRLYGIIGLGNNVSGRIRVVASGPSEEFQASKVSADLAGAIVVGGSWASAAAIKKLIEVGAAGLITGGLVDREVTATFGVAADDRLAPWRMNPGVQAIGEEFNPRIALMATEGFGPLPMHSESFALLKELDGMPAVLFTATRITGYLARPNLIVVNEEMLDEDAPTHGMTLHEGMKGRLVDQSSLGQHVTIVGGPRRTRHGDGTLLEVVDVQLLNGQARTVPLANVEIVTHA